MNKPAGQPSSSSPSGTRIQTANYTRITRAYLEKVVVPIVAALETKSAPEIQALRIGGVAISLRSQSAELSEYFRKAFCHLPALIGEPEDLTVFAWDATGSGVSLTPPWKSPEYFSLETEIRHQTEDGFVGVYSHYDDTMTLYDPTSKRAYFWIFDAAKAPVWIRAAPLRTLLQWVLGDRDIHLIHGAVIAEEGAAVLLTAKGGSGKSTTSLSCLKIGMQYLADDYVAVSRDAEPTAYSLYNSIKVAPYYGQEFDPAHVSETEGEKSVVYLAPLFPKQMAYSATLKAVLIPKIAHRESTAIVPATKAEAMLALIPTTLFQLPLAESNKVQLLASIIAKLPCYTVELGTDTLEAAQAIRTFVKQEL